MFICHKCAKENYVIDDFWLVFGPQSRGPCEDCGTVAVCVDMPSSSWKVKPSSEQNPERSVATEDHQGTEAGKQKI